MEIIKIAHVGKPCDPPVAEGVLFELLEGDVFVGHATEEQAEILLRIPAFTVYGGSAQIPGGSPAPEGSQEVTLDPGIEGAFPTDKELKAMNKGDGLEYAKTTFGLDLVGDAPTVKAELLNLVAAAKAQLYADKAAGANEENQ